MTKKVSAPEVPFDCIVVDVDPERPDQLLVRGLRAGMVPAFFREKDAIPDTLQRGMKVLSARALWSFLVVSAYPRYRALKAHEDALFGRRKERTTEGARHWFRQHPLVRCTGKDWLVPRATQGTKFTRRGWRLALAWLHKRKRVPVGPKPAYIPPDRPIVGTASPVVDRPAAAPTQSELVRQQWGLYLTGKPLFHYSVQHLDDRQLVWQVGLMRLVATEEGRIQGKGEWWSPKERQVKVYGIDMEVRQDRAVFYYRAPEQSHLPPVIEVFSASTATDTGRPFVCGNGLALSWGSSHWDWMPSILATEPLVKRTAGPKSLSSDSALGLVKGKREQAVLTEEWTRNYPHRLVGPWNWLLGPAI